MEIRRAGTDMVTAVGEMCRETVGEVYPKYYPGGAVDFFKAHHCDENIRADIEAGLCYLLYDGEPERLSGTVTVKENSICRLFVPAGLQRRGYGRYLLDFAEGMISERFSECVLDASFPAKHIYLKRGYREREFHSILTGCGDFLCYDVMAKPLRQE